MKPLLLYDRLLKDKYNIIYIMWSSINIKVHNIDTPTAREFTEVSNLVNIKSTDIR